MKMLFYTILLSTFYVTCKPTNQVAEANSTATSLSPDWLQGKWHRINDEGMKKTYEQWTKISDSLYMGLGFTMQGIDTVWKETVHLNLKDSLWSYDVFMAESTAPTSFVFSEHTDTSFICENAQNEFPKKIAYTLKGDTISATISGGGPEILYLFVKE